MLQEENIKADGALDESAESADKKAARSRKKKFYEITPEDDIAYKGPLSYRYVKIIGWALLALACYGTVLDLYKKYIDESYGVAARACQYGKELAVTLLLIAGFAVVLNGRDNYKRVLLSNGACALGLAGLGLLVYERYILRLGEALLDDRSAAADMVSNYFSGGGAKGYLAFNIFIDLTMCTLVMFFVNYTPKKYFQGKRICVFRAMILLPVCYEIASVALKMLASMHEITLPVPVFPFLTAKPPVSFLLFLSAARYFKRTEKAFIKHGRSHEDYESYLKTNHNSFRFSKYFSRKILKYAFIDLVLFFALVLIVCKSPEDDEQVRAAAETVIHWGFGETVGMILIIPIMLLFSYTKTHKSIVIDILIPAVSVAVIVLIYIDGLFCFGCDFFKTASASLGDLIL